MLEYMDKNTEDKNTKTEKKKKKIRISNRVKSIFKITSVIVSAGFLLTLGAGTGYVASIVKNEPVRTFSSIKEKVNDNTFTTNAYYRDNTPIGQLQSQENRLPVKLNQVSPYLLDAIVATEDKNFYEHFGVDIYGFSRAVYQQITGADVKTGGSTLTQQLVKQAFLTPEKTATRKVKEIFLALRLERALEKDEILEAYVNRMYFGKNQTGSNLYGVEAAAKGYFGVHAKDLSLAQAAYLAGMLQLPGKYLPTTDSGYKAGMARQKIVLQRMLETGKITQKQHDDAVKVNLKSQLKTTQTKVFDEYPYLHDEIFRRAAEILVEQEIAKNPALKKDSRQALIEDKILEVRDGGYHIYTTIDQNVYDTMQKIGQNPSNFGGPRTDWETGKVYPEQIGAVMINNKTGAILGMLEGRGYEQGAYNRATMAKRQPGSTMKPIAVYGPAVEEGIVQPGTIVVDEPISIGSWSPNNADNKFSGPMTVRTALQWSRNIPAIKVFLATGIVKSLSYVKEMGVTSLVLDKDVVINGQRFNDKNASSAIGGLTYGITVEELTNAYATFANQGQFIDAYLIEKIEDTNHKVIYQHKITPKTVFSPQTAWLLTDMMRSVVLGGTATSVQQYTSGRIVAGKTGTTNNDKDSWFVGYTPDITLGVWFGFDNQKFTNINTARAKTIWGKIFSEVVNSQPSISPAGRGFSQPGGIVSRTIDKTNGYLATPDSKNKVNEYFKANSAPNKYSPKPEEEKKDKPDNKDNKPKPKPNEPDKPQEKPDNKPDSPNDATPPGRTNPGEDEEN